MIPKRETKFTTIVGEVYADNERGGLALTVEGITLRFVSFTSSIGPESWPWDIFKHEVDKGRFILIKGMKGSYA